MSPTRVLTARGLTAGYGRIEVVHGIDLHADAGEIVAVLGANGAGKTTTLLSLAGALPAGGTVELFGRPARGALHQRAREGLAFLPDQRGIVRALTVEQNLRLAQVDVAAALDISGELRALLGRRAGTLSGGEQQILALTRAIASGPKLLLVDEMSFGLAPIVVTRMFALLARAAAAGTAVVLVEQFARHALEVADRAYVLRRGTVAVEGPADELLRDIGSLERSYFGGAEQAA
jgi:branched-chain amino acid transport system ATP-binding protein